MATKPLPDPIFEGAHSGPRRRVGQRKTRVVALRMTVAKAILPFAPGRRLCPDIPNFAAATQSELLALSCVADVGRLHRERRLPDFSLLVRLSETERK
jgi:hypothetical protein